MVYCWQEKATVDSVPENTGVVLQTAQLDVLQRIRVLLRILKEVVLLVVVLCGRYLVVFLVGVRHARNTTRCVDAVDAKQAEIVALRQILLKQLLLHLVGQIAHIILPRLPLCLQRIPLLRHDHIEVAESHALGSTARSRKLHFLCLPLLLLPLPLYGLVVAEELLLLEYLLLLVRHQTRFVAVYELLFEGATHEEVRVLVLNEIS